MMSAKYWFQNTEYKIRNTEYKYGIQKNTENTEYKYGIQVRIQNAKYEINRMIWKSYDFSPFFLSFPYSLDVKFVFRVISLPGAVIGTIAAAKFGL